MWCNVGLRIPWLGTNTPAGRTYMGRKFIAKGGELGERGERREKRARKKAREKQRDGNRDRQRHRETCYLRETPPQKEESGNRRSTACHVCLCQVPKRQGWVAFA